MRIAVVGAGAIGCFLAARLSERGHDITLVGRETQVVAIRERGLLVHDVRGGSHRYTVHASTSLEERPDLVLLTVKTQDVQQACRDILPVVHDIPVVALQNGLRGEELAAEILGRRAMIGGVVMIAATYLQPGEVTVHFAGWLILGEPFGQSRQRTQKIARALGEAVPTFETRHLDRVRWTKLIANLNNGLCAATGLALPDLVRTPLGRLLSVRVMKEGVAVAGAAGVHLDAGLYGLAPHAVRRDPNAALIALVQASMTGVLATLPERAALALLGAAGKSRLNALPIRGSTWQSLARGRPSEIEYLNGEIVRQGRILGVATPYNAHLVESVHRVEREGRFCELAELAPHVSDAQAQIPVGSETA